MKTIIAGSREIAKPLVHVEEAVRRSGFKVTQVVSGTARGVDAAGEEWAHRNSIPIVRHAANWRAHGKSAGYKRNEQMADYAEALVAVWDGASRGTKHMIDIATRKGLQVYVHTVQ